MHPPVTTKLLRPLTTKQHVLTTKHHTPLISHHTPLLSRAAPYLRPWASPRRQ